MKCCFAVVWNNAKWGTSKNIEFFFWKSHFVPRPSIKRVPSSCTFSTSQLPKAVWTWCVLYILTSRCASRHNGVHFFDMSTSKSGPTLVCFLHVGLNMCFAPQRRPQFSTSQLRKVLWTWCVLHILTSKCASRHNFHLSSPQMARHPPLYCSEPTFRPSGATNHWKNTVFRNFPTFSRTCIFCLLALSLLWSSFFFSSLLSLTLPTSPFSSVHNVGSLTSKLPSFFINTIIILTSHSYIVQQNISFWWIY